MPKKYLIILIIILAVLGVGVFALRTPKTTEIASPIVDKTDEQNQLRLAQEAVKDYENALKTRRRDEVLSYTIGKLKEEVQGWPFGFGMSNPHPAGCEILGSQKINSTEFEVKARHLEEYTGQGIIGYNDNIYRVEKVGDKYFISSIEYGKYIDIAPDSFH